MPPIVIADSDDSDGFDASPAKGVPHDGAGSHPPPTTHAIAPTMVVGHDDVSSSHPLPDMTRTDSTDELFFQRVYNEHNDAALRQFAIQNNATTTAKMGQPSSRLEQESSSGDRDTTVTKARSSSDGKRQADPSSLTDPGHPSKHRKTKKTKLKENSDTTNDTTPSRSSEKVEFDPYAFPDSGPEHHHADPRIKLVKPKSEMVKLSTVDGTPDSVGHQATGHTLSLDLPSSFKKMRPVPNSSSLTHVTETPIATTDAVIISRTSSGKLIDLELEQSAKRRRVIDNLSHITETPEDGEVDLVQVGERSISSNNTPYSGAPLDTNFYIQPGTITQSQMLEYQPVAPTPSYEDGDGLPPLPATGNDGNQNSSADASTVAYTTPSRFQSTDPRLRSEPQTSGNMDQVSPKLPTSARRKTKIVLKKRPTEPKSCDIPPATVVATELGTATGPLPNDVIMINSSPDEISAAAHPKNLESANAGGPITSQDPGEMAPQLRSARGRKRRSIEDEDELSALHGDESCDSRATKRRSGTSNAPHDTESFLAHDEVPATAPMNINIKVVAESPTATPPKVQKTCGRKKKEPIATTQTGHISAETSLAETSTVNVAPLPERKPKKKRGRPRKSDAVAQPGAAAASPASVAFESPVPEVAQLEPPSLDELSESTAPAEPTSKSKKTSRSSEVSDSSKANKVLKETSPNVFKPESKKDKTMDDSSTAAAEKLGPSKAPSLENESEKVENGAEKKATANPASRYRVGLSRNARIQPLLKVIRK
ncbi:hypothetical protein MKZ38_001111 [Zalerion maritima]|uniref:Uncharacterized protein n=1 Tax=Zalerion maritima TaxID=339359 RepID=A0AAD5RYC3_9PEZI|nr:hypothetical protein MKZ38_001111 [Zalerion maritima]